MTFTIPKSLFAVLVVASGHPSFAAKKDDGTPSSTMLLKAVADDSMCVDAWAVHETNKTFFGEIDSSYPYGWTNGLDTNSSTVTFPLFTEPDLYMAEVGDLQVGSLVVAQNNGTVTLDFTANGTFFEDVHVYVGGSPLYNNGEVVVTKPAEFPSVTNDVDAPTFQLMGTSMEEEDLHLIAHVTVCGPQFFVDEAVNAKLSRRRRRPRRGGRRALRGGGL